MRFQLAVAISAAVMLSSCAWNANGSRVGLLYQSTAENISVTSKPVNSSSGTGVACSVSYFGLVHVGDASVTTAMKSAGIREVSVVDKTSENILGVWGRSCTVVRGD